MSEYFEITVGDPQENSSGAKILCPNCKTGEVTTEELVRITYEIVSDGKGGYDYTGNKLSEDGATEDEIEAICRECSWSVPLSNLSTVEIGGKVFAE